LHNLPYNKLYDKSSYVEFGTDSPLTNRFLAVPSSQLVTESSRQIADNVGASHSATSRPRHTWALYNTHTTVTPLLPPTTPHFLAPPFLFQVLWPYTIFYFFTLRLTFNKPSVTTPAATKKATNPTTNPCDKTSDITTTPVTTPYTTTKPRCDKWRKVCFHQYPFPTAGFLS